MAVAFVNVSGINNGQTYTAGAGTNRLVILLVTFMDDAAGTTITGITHGGVALHRIGGVTIDTGSGNRPNVDAWYLNEADGIPSGAQTVTVSYSAAVSTTHVHCFTVSGAHQTDFTITNSDASTSATSLSTTLASRNGSLAIAGVSALHNASITDVTPNWTGATEARDGTSGSPTQRYWSAYRAVATATTETIAPSWAAATPAALFAFLIKDVADVDGGNPLAHIKRYGSGRYIPFGR